MDTYESPLAARNASAEMLKLFSPRHRIGLWRRLWLELAKQERALGITRITPEALSQMAAKLDDIDFALAASWEKRLRHDVMATCTRSKKSPRPPRGSSTSAPPASTSSTTPT